MPAHDYTLALVFIWMVVMAAAYVSPSLFQSRAHRTIFTFAPFLPILLLNWFGMLNVWPLSIPLPDMGPAPNVIVYSGLLTGACVFLILRFTKDQHRGNSHDPR